MNRTKKIETVAVIGLGAMGCSYLGKISETIPMEMIQAIASGARAERYRKNGIVLNGRRIDFPIAEPHEAKPADLLIFTVKFNQLKEAIDEARGAVGPDTIVISLLNGITSERLIADVYGEEHVLYSLALGIDATRSADETNVTVYGVVPFGAARNEPGNYDERVVALKEFWGRVGLNSEIPEDMHRALWQKFMMNVGVNQTSAVLECPYGGLQRGTEAKKIVVSAMEEVVALSAYEDVHLGQADIDRALTVLDTLSPGGKCSMLQDVEARRPTEVAIFGGTVVELGKKHGVPTPVNDMLVRIIRAKEELFG